MLTEIIAEVVAEFGGVLVEVGRLSKSVYRPRIWPVQCVVIAIPGIENVDGLRALRGVRQRRGDSPIMESCCSRVAFASSRLTRAISFRMDRQSVQVEPRLDPRLRCASMLRPMNSGGAILNSAIAVTGVSVMASARCAQQVPSTLNESSTTRSPGAMGDSAVAVAISTHCR